MKYKFGAENTVTDTLSRRSRLLTTLALEVVGFNVLKGDYTKDKEFDKVYEDLTTGMLREHPQYSIHNDSLLR